MAQPRYSAIPKSSHAPVEVALVAATRKTVLQVATPSTRDIVVVSWGISFDGTVANADPVIVDLIEVDVAATVTSLTPEKYSDPNAPLSLCPGGAALTGYNATAEGAIGASRLLDTQEVHPTSGITIQFPLGREPGVAVSKFLRLRALAGANVNCIPQIIWEE